MFNKKILSLIAIIVIIAICLALASSCASEKEKNDNADINAAGDSVGDNSQDPNFENPSNFSDFSNDESLYDPNLPEADFEEYIYKILNVDEEFMSWAINHIDVEESIGDVVDDAIYTRNRNTEAKYNFIIKQIRMSAEDIDKAIKNTAQAGTYDYDLVIPYTLNVPSHATSGYLADLGSLPYINLDKPWWNHAAGSDFSIGSKTFFSTSDFILIDKENTVILGYNNKVAQDIGAPSVAELYNTVFEGKWTFDMFADLCRSAYVNLDGTGVINYSTDRIGIVGYTWWFSNVFMVGFDETVIKKDENDLPYVACKTDRFTEAYSKLVSLTADKKAVGRAGLDFDGSIEPIFERNGSLFATMALNGFRIMRNMNSDFTLLPMPKLNEEQEKYYAPVLEAVSVAIPNSCEDTDRSAFIIEALTAESMKILNPAYYEVALQDKYMRDSESVKMLELVLNNRMTDICYSIYNWAGFTDQYREAFKKDNPNFTSLIDKHEKRLTTAMEKTVNAYAALD